MLTGVQGRVDVNSGFIAGIEKSGRIVARREGSLVLLGKKRAEVLAFRPVEIVARLLGGGSVVRRVKRGAHIIVKSDSPIEAVGVKPLHPVLSGDEYAALCRERSTDDCGTIKVPFKRVHLRLVESRAMGILCHCGKWFGSRNSLLGHLHSSFGHPVGALTSKPATREEAPLRFESIQSKWGSTSAVYTPLPGNQWTGTIEFSKGEWEATECPWSPLPRVGETQRSGTVGLMCVTGAPTGPVFLRASSKFAVEPSTVSCSPGTSVAVRLR